jgi:hypothetical protein
LFAISPLNPDRTRRNARESPLLRLPAELRDEIYKYALCGRVWDITPDYWDDDRPRLHTSEFLALLETSRQLYNETALLPFALGIFKFWHGYAAELVAHFTTAQRDAIQTIRLTVSWSYMYELATQNYQAKRMEKNTIFIDQLHGLRVMYFDISVYSIRDDPSSWETFRASIREVVQWVRKVRTVDKNSDIEVIVKYRAVSYMKMDWVTLEL